jgi:hypothetical protein
MFETGKLTTTRAPVADGDGYTTISISVTTSRPPRSSYFALTTSPD